MIRKPVVAGQFYPNDQDELKIMIKQCFGHKFGPGKQPPIKSDEKIEKENFLDYQDYAKLIE